MKNPMEMNRIELIEELRACVPVSHFQDAMESSTAMLRAYIAYARSKSSEKGSDKFVQKAPDQYIGFHFTLQPRMKLMGYAFDMQIYVDRKKSENERHFELRLIDQNCG